MKKGNKKKMRRSQARKLTLQYEENDRDANIRQQRIEELQELIRLYEQVEMNGHYAIALCANLILHSKAMISLEEEVIEKLSEENEEIKEKLHESGYKCDGDVVHASDFFI